MLFTARPPAALQAMEVTFSEVTSESSIAEHNSLEVIFLNPSVTSDSVGHCFLYETFIVLWLPGHCSLLIVLLPTLATPQPLSLSHVLYQAHTRIIPWAPFPFGVCFLPGQTYQDLIIT